MKTQKTILAAITAALAFAGAAHADSPTFLPMLSNNNFVPETTKLDDLKACIKNNIANDSCEITMAMTVAWSNAGFAEPMKFRVRDRGLHTDQAVFVRFDRDEATSCDIGWHVQKDFWWSECKGALRGDGGENTVFTSTAPLQEDAYRFIWALGLNAGTGRAGNITTEEKLGFLTLDFKNESSFCRLDNPFTTDDESRCIR